MDIDPEGTRSDMKSGGKQFTSQSSCSSFWFPYNCFLFSQVDSQQVSCMKEHERTYESLDEMESTWTNYIQLPKTSMNIH